MRRALRSAWDSSFAGSHAVYVRPADGKSFVIPIHAGADLKRKTLRAIIEDMGITTEEFTKLL